MTRPESQPRPPLALLADWLEARERLLEAHATRSRRTDLSPFNAAHDSAFCAITDLNPAALRAQAEAEANRERAYRLALLGLQRQDTGCWCYTLTGGHAPECLQASAALAQAGGES